LGEEFPITGLWVLPSSQLGKIINFVGGGQSVFDTGGDEGERSPLVEGGGIFLEGSVKLQKRGWGNLWS